MIFLYEVMPLTQKLDVFVSFCFCLEEKLILFLDYFKGEKNANN